MSQRIVTECDECQALGQTTDGATVGVRALAIEVEVDLCDVHVKPLADLLARFVELGRIPSDGRRTTGRATCPRCGRKFATPQALGRHAKADHGETLPELRAHTPAAPVVEAGAFTCPECGRGFPKAQGLAVHRRRSHGVDGTSRASASRARAASDEGEAHEDG